MTSSAANASASRNVVVLGAGAWGSVLSAHLAKKGCAVTAWDADPEVLERLDAERTHPKIDGLEIPGSVRFVKTLEEAMTAERRDCVVSVVPSHALRETAARCRDLEPRIPGAAPPWVLCSKGIEEETLLPMAAVVEDVRGEAWRERIAVLSGPSFAAEVALDKPTTVCVASTSAKVRDFVQDLFMTERFRVYTQDDVLGVELGGSVKNVVAVAAGACDGMHLGENGRAALITRGLAEIMRLGAAMGARAGTFAGLAGMGDLILTCGGALSRNHQFGELLAQGRTCDEALEEIGMTVEGMRTTRSTRALARRHGVEMPIVEEVYRVIYEGKSPKDALHDLMVREPRPERD